MAVAMGGAAALLVPVFTDRVFDLPTGATILLVWIGLSGAFACPDRPGIRPLPPLLRAAALGGCCGAIAAALASDALVYPAVALGIFVLVGAVAATPWTQPADERPVPPPRRLARAAAWTVPVVVVVLAAVLLPLAILTDRAVAAAYSDSVADRTRAAARHLDAVDGAGGPLPLLDRLPGVERSATLSALRGRVLISLYRELLDAPATAARAKSLRPLLDDGLKALGDAQRAWREQPGPPAAAARAALAAVADLDAISRDDEAARRDPALGQWRNLLVANAVSDAERVVGWLPTSARARWIWARALLVKGDIAGATRELDKADKLAKRGPARFAPTEHEFRRAWLAIHDASGR
jgi:hypothetical protein